MSYQDHCRHVLSYIVVSPFPMERVDKPARRENRVDAENSLRENLSGQRDFRALRRKGSASPAERSCLPHRLSFAPGEARGCWFPEYIVLQNERVEVALKKEPQCLLRGLDDRHAAPIERGIEQHAETGAGAEGLEQVVEAAVPFGGDSLNPARAVPMDDAGQSAAPGLAHWGDED